MNIDNLKKDFPLAGQEFAIWFAETYRLDEDIYNTAPHEHQILAIYKFLGYGMHLESKKGLEWHEKVALERLKNYNKLLGSFDEIISFEETIQTMSQEECFSLFMAGKESSPYRFTIKDAITRTEPAIPTQEFIKEPKPSQKSEDDKFWLSIKSQSEPPPF